jgi:hypothetical protein
MLFSLLYFLVRRVLGAGSRLQDEKDIELLVLRHQVKGAAAASEAPSTAPVGVKTRITFVTCGFARSGRRQIGANRLP